MINTFYVARSGYLTVELWADQVREMLIVPPMLYEASLFIHRRRLALYRA